MRQLLINEPNEMRVEGKAVPIIHVYGKKNYTSEMVPLLKKTAFELAAASMKAITGFDPRKSGFHYHAERITVEKYREIYAPGIGQDAVYKLTMKGYQLRDIARRIGAIPYEIHVSHGWRFLPLNGMLNEGLDQIWDLVTEADATNYYTNALARNGVGNSAVGFAATQTALQGGSTAFSAQEATFPTSTTQKVTFKGSFGSGVAEFAWEEHTVDNGSSPNKNLNRAVTNKGTKGAGETWTQQIEITGS